MTFRIVGLPPEEFAPLFDLDDELTDIDYLPYGGHLKAAEQLLEDGERLDGQLNRHRLVARLLSLADRVIEGEFQRQANGRSRPDKGAQKRRRPETDSGEADKKKKKEAKKSKQTETKNNIKKRRRK